MTCAEGNIEIRGPKINCFLRDQSQSDLLYNLKCEAANSLNLAVSRRSTSAGNSALLPSDGEGSGEGGLEKDFSALRASVWY